MAIDNRVRAAGVDPSAFRHINEAGEDVEVCRESLELLRVLALDVLRVLDEDTLIRPKPVKAKVNAEVASRSTDRKSGLAVRAKTRRKLT